MQMIINIVDQCRNQNVPKMRKNTKTSWMVLTEHTKEKTPKLRQTERESSDENREYYTKALNIFTREARRSK